MNVVFLDYDGVVNTPMWDEDGRHCRYNFPEDGKVNNFQCVQWVSEFCEKLGYDIVVSSSWRDEDNYIDCLKNGGLRDGVKVLGKTPEITGATRGAEIKAWLKDHPDVEYFLIFDDDVDVDGMEDHLVLCDANTGFGIAEFYEADRLHEQFRRRKIAEASPCASSLYTEGL